MRKTLILPQALLLVTTIFLLLYLFIAFSIAPYVIIYILTKFDPGHSTVSQRSWIMGFFVLTQQGSPLLALISGSKKFRYFAGSKPILAFLITALITTLLAIPTVGGFVVVAKMMLEDDTCRRL